ncbi:hypothetical protein [Zobellella aerophila]|uniref:Uncharacterized protein n=1 Tax=Zobellella aerophila TaxID=870480 RepID=A0ABP6VGR9_9GAMM
MTEFVDLATETWDELQDKRKKLREASDHYDQKVQSLRAGKCKREDVVKAFRHKQQAHDAHAEAFHRIFKVPENI